MAGAIVHALARPPLLLLLLLLLPSLDHHALSSSSLPCTNQSTPRFHYDDRTRTRSSSLLWLPACLPCESCALGGWCDVLLEPFCLLYVFACIIRTFHYLLLLIQGGRERNTVLTGGGDPCESDGRCMGVPTANANANGSCCHGKVPG